MQNMLALLECIMLALLEDRSVWTARHGRLAIDVGLWHYISRKVDQLVGGICNADMSSLLLLCMLAIFDPLK